MPARTDKQALISNAMNAARAFQAAAEHADEQIALRAGVNRTDLRWLDHLTRVGSLTAGELAEVTGLTTGAMTLAIDRLECARLVKRVRDEADRRRVRVEATAKADRLIEKLYGDLGELGRQHLARLSSSELRTVTRFLQGARQLNEDHATRLRESWRGTRRSAGGRRGPPRTTA